MIKRGKKYCIVVLIKIETKIEYNKTHGLTCKLNGRYSNDLRQ